MVHLDLLFGQVTADRCPNNCLGIVA